MKTTLDYPLLQSSVSPVIGWDVGGAHLKAVRMDAMGQLAVSLVYCPLWRGLTVLSEAMDQALNEFGVAPNGHKHYLTMTGELADIFPNRLNGVKQIAEWVQEKLAEPVQFYAGYQHWSTLPITPEKAPRIASMNWLASVEFLAKKVSNALFIDIGSTTTDLVLICNGKPKIIGFSDAVRLQTDELIYTGVVRTPLMALAQKIRYFDVPINLAAEYFATTADVYTLTGDLPQSEYTADTADGADKSPTACARRIARMIGRDADEAPLSDWQTLAQVFKALQLQQIKQAVVRHLDSCPDGQNYTLLGAGVGDFLLPGLAQQLNLAYLSVSDFMPTEQQASRAAKRMASVCFPAYAVASLGRSHA